MTVAKITQISNISSSKAASQVIPFIGTI